MARVCRSCGLIGIRRLDRTKLLLHKVANVEPVRLQLALRCAGC